MKHKTKHTKSGTYLTVRLQGDHVSNGFWFSNGLFLLANSERKEVYLSTLVEYEYVYELDDVVATEVTMWVPFGVSTHYRQMAEMASKEVCRSTLMIPYRQMLSLVRNSNLEWFQE